VTCSRSRASGKWRRAGAAFDAGRVHKRYLALVRGWPPAEGEIDYALGARSRTAFGRPAAVGGGRALPAARLL
jgi:23S rRNA-/tRNA-specific pseudouridylate synthase